MPFKYALISEALTGLTRLLTSLCILRRAVCSNVTGYGVPKELHV